MIVAVLALSGVPSAAHAGHDETHRPTQGIVGLDIRTGKVLWRSDPDRPGRLELALAYGGFVYGVRKPECERGKQLTLVAVDEATGAERWRATMSGVRYEDMQKVGPGPDAIVVIGTDGLLHGLNPRTGDVVWRVPLDGNEMIGGSADLVLLRSKFDSAPFPDAPVSVYARSRADGSLVWTHEVESGRLLGTVSADGEVVAVFTVGSTMVGPLGARSEALSVLDARSGTELWSRDGGSRHAVSGATVVVREADGIHGFDAISGGELWRLPRGTTRYDLAHGVSRRTPLILQQEKVARIGSTDGSIRWETTFAPPAGPYAISSQLVLLSSHEHRMVAVDARTGAVRWTRDNRPPWARTTVIGSRVVAIGGLCNTN